MQSTNLSSVIQVRLDPELKQASERFFQDIGLDVPSAIRLFLKQSIIQNRIPFPIIHQNIKSPTLQKYTRKELDTIIEAASITNSLAGALKSPKNNDITLENIRDERLEKYERLN